MDYINYDAIIIGAGAAGLMAAWELVLAGKKVAVIEARERTGGRIHTIQDANFEMPVEMGAEFIHGKLEPTLPLLEKAGVKYYHVLGDFWQYKDGKISEQKDFIEDYNLLNRQFKKLDHDMSVADFMENYLQGDRFEEMRFTLKNYVEGYYAADIQKSSTFSLRDELNGADKEQFRIEGGYRELTDHLYHNCMEKGVSFYLTHVVSEIQWKKNNVTVVSHPKTFSAKKVLVTVPVGVLQTEKIKFMPALHQKMAAARHLGYGPVIKTIIQFYEPFWKNKKYTQGENLSKMSFIFSKERIPTWWSYHPKDVAMLTGWSGGPHAEEIKGMDNDTILKYGIDSLQQIFDLEQENLKKNVKGWHVANWSTDPFSCGAYSYDVVGGATAMKIISQPEEDTVYFAGEGLIDGPEIGTVNAALVSGRDIARNMIAAFKK